MILSRILPLIWVTIIRLASFLGLITGIDSGPLYTKAEVESLNLQFLGVLYLELTSLYPKFKVWRASPILKYTSDHAWSERLRGEVILNKGEFITSQTMLEILTFLSDFSRGSSGFWLRATTTTSHREFVVVVPSIYLLSKRCEPNKMLNSQIEISSVKWILERTAQQFHSETMA